MATITEALAEIKTIGKRLPTKRQFIGSNIARQEGLKDPLEKDGGSIVALAAARQSIVDLETRHVALRLAIQEVNRRTDVTVDGETHSLAWWLTWRKEVLPGRKAFLQQLRQGVMGARAQAQQKGFQVVTVNQQAQANTDVLIHLDEAALAVEMEHLEKIEGELDGQLSLKNATVMVDL